MRHRPLQNGKRKLLVPVAAILALALVLIGCGSSGSGSGGSGTSGSGSLTKISIVVPVVNGSNMPIWIAQGIPGFWAKYGLDVNIVQVSNTVEYTQLGSGNVDLACCSGAGLVAAQKGAPIKIIGLLGPLYTVLMTQPNITSIADLKGKKVGASSPGSSFDAAQRALLAQYGLTSPKDYSVVYSSGSTTAVYTALASGNISATPVSVPQLFTLQQQNPNLKSLMVMNSDPKIATLLSLIISANTNWASAHKSQLVEFIKGWNAAISYIKANPDQSASILAKAGDVSHADAVRWIQLQESTLRYTATTADEYNTIVESLVATSPAVKSESYQAAVDNSYVTAAS